MTTASAAAAAAVAAAVICSLLPPPAAGQQRLCESYTPTLDGGECTTEDKECEFKLVVDYKLTLTETDRTGLFVRDYDVYREQNGGDPLGEEELKDVVLGDGMSPFRMVTVVNGTMPGPCLTFFKDQTVKIHVVNNLPSEALTIHWHGLEMFDNSYMDGVTFVSQCPIQSGETFVYTVVGRKPGSYWYHSHIGAQRTMGILGPLVLLERGEVLPRNERVMVLQDWNHDFTSDRIELGTYEINDGKMVRRGSTKSLDGASISPYPFHSGLINGRARFYRSTSPVVYETKTPLEIFEVERDKTYRFRVIGAGVVAPFRVSVEGHQMSVVASDGHDFQPVPAESFVINPGERYDFLLYTNQTINNYMILAESLEVNLKVRHVAEAVLHYKGANPARDRMKQAPYLPSQGRERGCESHQKCTVVNCPFQYYPMGDNTECVNLGNLKSQGAPSDTRAPTSSDIRQIFLGFGFTGGLIGSRPVAPSINGIKFQWPPVPAILKPDRFPKRCESCRARPGLEPGSSSSGEAAELCSCAHTVPLVRDGVHQLVLVNMGKAKGESHPIHIHGYSFYLVKMGYPPYDPQTGQLRGENTDVECMDEFCNVARWANTSWTPNDVPGLNLVNPIRKDTIILPTGGYVVLRLKANNPGMWFVHCHIEMHHLGGMALILDGSQGGLPPPPAGFPVCDNFPQTQGLWTNGGRELSVHLCTILSVLIILHLLLFPFTTPVTS